MNTSSLMDGLRYTYLLTLCCSTFVCIYGKGQENVEIRQNDKRVEGELISYLTFTRISIDDDGLYRCTLKGYKDELISHNINISVSDLNQGVKISDYNEDELPSADDEDDDDEDVPWLPYFFICVSIALLVVTLTVLTLLRCYGCKRQLNHTEGQVMQERSTHMIPDLPIILHYTCSPSTAKRPPSQAPPMANTADESRVSDRVCCRQPPTD
ncbi:uncharacterized protein LOC116395461 [Anarrhichthys ocellatus]|uniref:uncharacterized protein LOC116395461 n=1 Tax=Anarrhichthys ocellatus TaxID=433405 RepID=UPI0012EEA14A|nr:uncharacterized protein LOC116395461 [Anarrhichthys ocellatus]